MGAPDLAIPRRVVYVDKIPLFATGKKDYPKHTQMVEAQLVQPSL
jgi:hypothetical protein